MRKQQNGHQKHAQEPKRLALVLGAGGMVGAHVVRALLARGYGVRALLRSGFARPNLAGLDIEVVAGDLEDRASLDGAMYGVDSVVHCAGYYVKHSIGEMRQMARALVQTRNVLGAARDARVRKLVFTSTSATIGNPSHPDALADEDSPLTPECRDGLYQRIKCAMESEVMRAGCDGIPVVVVNPSFVVGEYDMRPRPMAILARVAAGEAPFLVDARCNWVDARDVGEGHLLALEHGQVGRRYVLGGENLSYADISHRVATLAETKPPRILLPYKVAMPLAWTSELWSTFFSSGSSRGGSGDSPYLPVVALHELKYASYLSSARAEGELGYKSRPIGEALEQALAWYRRLGYVQGPIARVAGAFREMR